MAEPSTSSMRKRGRPEAFSMNQLATNVIVMALAAALAW